MGKDVKPMHNNFVKYMLDTVKDDAYSGLPYSIKKDGNPSWVATKTSTIGRQRITWATDKAKSLGIDIDKPFFSKVMLAVHPTKKKPCHVCGKYMSLFYVYPSKNFAQKINKQFVGSWTELDSLHDIVDELLEYQTAESSISQFLAKEFELKGTQNKSIHDVVDMCENECRCGNKAKLGPGAMSNFPDRYDGFHSYNRCCRSKEDKGRHVENMNSYNKDRRAYELWSDGNIKAANSFMHSAYFKGTTADHIGPISLGFKHESFLLKKMSGSDNSSKRDRLFKEDIELLILIEKEHSPYCAISRQSTLLWSYIKSHYLAEENLEKYQQALKQSTNNYLSILWNIAQIHCQNGVDFLVENLLKPKFEEFSFSYDFDDFGNHIAITKRHITDSTRKEWDRILRISFDSLEDYHLKDNRNIKTAFSKETIDLLNQLLGKIIEKDATAVTTFNDLLIEQQKSLLSNLE